MRSSLQPGMTLQGRYKILSQIGKGGMGYVFKATALRLNKECAIKEMQANFIAQEDRAKIALQFQNEAETLAKIDHPGIPRILDTFEENDRHYLVMEFVDGRTLEDIVMDSSDFLPEPQVLNWLHQITDILHYLHTRPSPIILRDLKPANIMLTEEGMIKIIDFGIAKIFDRGKSQTMTTIKGSGSAGFAPPEQYGSSGTDPRSDIYSLGVTLYFLLTRIILEDSVDRILNGGVTEPMNSFNPTVTDPVERMVQKMIRLKPEDRYQGVDEIQSYLSEHGLQGAYIPAPRPTPTVLPSPEVKARNESLVELWKKEQERLTDLSSPGKQPVHSAGEPAEKEAPPERKPTFEDIKTEDSHPVKSNYKFVSEAMLSRTPERREKEEKKKNPFVTFLIIAAAIVVLGALGVTVFHTMLSPVLNPPVATKTPEPEPVKTEEPPPPPPPTFTEEVVEGKIVSQEKGGNDFHFRIRTDEGPVTLKMPKAQAPAGAKAGAVVQASYKKPREGNTKPPWEVISMTVVKGASQPAAQPGASSGAQSGGYRPPAYTPPPQQYRPPAPRQTSAPPPPAAPPSQGGSSGGGSLTHERANF